MRYFSLLILFFIPAYSWAIDYHLENKTDKNNHIDYYTLSVIDGDKKKQTSISLEGNANYAKISEILTFSCSWGKIEGVRVTSTSTSTSIDGTETMDEFFFFDKQLNNIYAKQYIRISEPNGRNPIAPISIKHSICSHSGIGVQPDTVTGKDYISDSETTIHGPFLAKDLKDVYIKYVINNDINSNDSYHIDFISENKYGDNLIDSYGEKNNSVAKIASVFFTPLVNQNHVINLVYWLSEDDNRCYQVYAYRYDQQGNFSASPDINNDPNLSGCDKGKQKFNYNTAAAIKAYLKVKYPNS